MKNKVSKQFLSVLLAFVMIIGLIPTSSVTVFPHIKKDAALTGGIFGLHIYLLVKPFTRLAIFSS